MKPDKKPFQIGIDIGGTKILVTLLDPKFNVAAESKSKVEAHKGEKVFFDSLVAGVHSVLKEAKVLLKSVACIGAGCPGMVRNPEGSITLSPNISFMKNYPLRKKIASYFKLPVVVENDVNAGLYGEFVHGAARGAQHVVGIFLGTGVGGGLILDGKIYRGANGAAGEIGHTFLNVPSMLTAFEREGTLEGEIGRLAISSEAGLLMLKQQAPKLYEEVGYDIKKIKSKALLHSLSGGDKAMAQLIEGKARLLGLAMANVVNLLNPEMIVLGGGLVESMKRYILPPARETMRKYAMAPNLKGIRVVAAQLGDYAIVKGAAQLALEETKKGRA